MLKKKVCRQKEEWVLFYHEVENGSKLHFLLFAIKRTGYG